MNEWGYALGSAAVVSLISLVGIVTMMVGVRRLDKVIPLLISLAVGGLFGDALVHLLPESFEKSTSPALTSFYVILGILLFLPWSDSFIGTTSIVPIRSTPCIRWPTSIWCPTGCTTCWTA